MTYLLCDELPDEVKCGIEMKSVGRKASGNKDRVLKGGSEI